MANQFSVDVPNVYQALMSGQQGYDTASQDAALTSIANAAKSGDNNALMEALFKAKQIGPAIELAKLGRQQEASGAFSAALGGIFGGQPQSSPQPQASPQPQGGAFQQVMQPQQLPPPPQGQSQPAPTSTITGVDYGPVQNAQTGTQIAPGAGYVPGTPQKTGQIGPSPSLAGVSLDKAVPVLLQAASNPSLPKEQQETARMLLGKAFDQYPQQIRELEIFKQRPDLFSMAKELKTAGATVINTAEGQQAAETKARIEIDKHAVTDLSKKVAASRSAIPLLNQMMAINDKTPGGWAGAAAPYLAKAAATLGIDVPEGASNAELFGAMSRQFIPSIRDPGSTSNYEQSLYMQAVPSLSQSPEGRAKIASMMRNQIDRNAETLATYRKYIGRPELDAKLTELDAKPMFTPEQKKTLEAALQPQSGGSFNDRFGAATGQKSTSTGVKWSFGP